jgi:hypothetical protein
MPNIIINQNCVRSCPYCFASNYMKADDAFMSWENFLYCIDFTQAAGVKAVSILGGEPSLHPHFLEFIEYALNRMEHVSVFTSGILPPGMPEEMAKLLSKKEFYRRITLVCNVNEPRITPPREWERVVDFFSHVGQAVVQSFNIYRLDFNLESLFQNIIRYGLRRRIRLSLAHPIFGRKNQHIHPAQYPAVVGRLADSLPAFEAIKTLPTLDCGFPICAFSDSDLGHFAKAGATFHWTCAPVIDIGPDLSVWPCFPLFAYNKQSLLDFNSLQELNDFFVRLVQGETRGNTGIYEECDGCTLIQRELCTGGCLANFIPSDNLSRIRDVNP